MGELRVKESNRLELLAENLRRLGGEAEVQGHVIIFGLGFQDSHDSFHQLIGVFGGYLGSGRPGKTQKIVDEAANAVHLLQGQ